MRVSWKAGETPGIASEILRVAAEVNRITVSARIIVEDARAEVMQSVVSQWSIRSDWGAFDAFDAAGTDGLESLGYFGAVFDGRYVYFVPEQKNRTQTHAIVLRHDTHGDFKDRGSYRAYDAGLTDGLHTRGYYGAAFDGRYVYFIPRQLDMCEYHTHVLRYDTRGEFDDPSSWQAHDEGFDQSSQGCAFDGRHIYFCPGFSGDPSTEASTSGRVIRLDTQGNFKSPASYRAADVAAFFGPQATGFDGGAFDGRYIYFIPLKSTVVVRYDTGGRFEDASSWQQFDAAGVGLGINVGMVFDGRYLYCCAYLHGTICRYDTTGDFTDSKSWESYRADGTDGLKTVGFDGGFFDGRYVHFVPFVAPGTGGQRYTFHGNFLRYDTRGAFADSRSWQARDASRTDQLRTVGYNAGAFDGRYFYAAPWQQGPKSDGSGPMIHANVLRYDTLGDGGAFSLRSCDYGHNGGLCAAIRGPSFLINLDRGCRSVASHTVLSPGAHELTGAFDGEELWLVVDGQVVAERAAAGRIVFNETPVTIGTFGQALAELRGKVLEVSIEADASR